MSKPLSFDQPEFNLVSSMDEEVSAPDPETPFRLLLMGDWAGRAGRRSSNSNAAEASPAHAWRTVEIDRDNFDEVLARLRVELHLQFGEREEQPPLIISFTELEDFHPDRLYERVELFQALRQTRRRLNDRATFAEAAAEVRRWAGRESASEPGEAKAPSITSATPTDATALTTSDLLAQMLEEGKRTRPTDARAEMLGGDLSQFLRDVVRPHLVADDDPQQAELTSAVDEATSGLMRAILHHPDFQSLEAAWRALYFLVTRVETDTNLKLYLLDVTKDELTADLSAADRARRSNADKLIVEQSIETPGADPWAALIGNYTFDATREDGELLARLGRIARRAGAPFIAAANPRVAGCASFAEMPDADDWRIEHDTEGAATWSALRTLPEAAFLGLALPRFLLRLPYGAEVDAIERFEFEEFAGPTAHEDYLWGNPAFACAYLLADAFSRSEWEMRPGEVLDIEDMPLHLYKEDGETRTKPCAEALLTERAAVKLLDIGLMPLLSFRDQDRVRLARFQSLAHPLAPLAGRWN